MKKSRGVRAGPSWRDTLKAVRLPRFPYALSHNIYRYPIL